MVFNVTFINISVIWWRSVLLVEETGVPGEMHRPLASVSLTYSTVCSKYTKYSLQNVIENKNNKHRNIKFHKTIHFCGFPIGYLFYKDRLNDWVVLRIKQIDWLIMRDIIRYVPVFIYNMIFRNDRRVILNWTFCRKWILTILSQILFRTAK